MSHEITVRLGTTPYKTTINTGKTTIIADKAKDSGGNDLGPDPTELLLAALGTCKAMTMRMYADRKEWPLEEVSIALSSEVVKSEQQQTTYIRCHISLSGDLDDEQRERLLDIAGKCPIQQVLTNTIEVTSNLVI